MKNLDAQVCIIGGGPGGLACADVLALHDIDVIVVNEGPLMGYAIKGAFTSKAEFEITRHYLYASQRADIFGEVPRPIFAQMMRGTREGADKLDEALKKRLARTPNVTLVDGRGSFVDAHTVAVDDMRIHAQHFVIATGSQPRIPEGVSTVPGRILTSDTVFDLETCPESMLVVGAGVIGCEFACIFSALGCAVQLLDTQPQILGMEDPDVGIFMAEALAAHGIEVTPSCRLATLAHDGELVTTMVEDGRQFTTDTVLLAVGRNAATASLNLDGIGVELDDRGYVPTNDSMRTNVAHIMAVGDVGQRNTTADVALVHVAQAEGRCAAHQIINESFNSKMDHVPYVVFTVPMLAGAGMNETNARQKFGADVRVGKYPHSRNHRAHANGPPIGFTKLIVGPPGDDRILGVRVVGREADTLVAAASIMIERQLPYTYLLDCILPHPSLIECLQGAAHIIDGDALDYEEGEEMGFEPV